MPSDRNPTRVCGRCGSVVALVRSPTGRTLVVDGRAGLDAVHGCVLGRPVAAVTLDGDTAAVAGLNAAGGYVAHVLGGRLSGPAHALPGVVRRLAGRGIVVVLTPPPAGGHR